MSGRTEHFRTGTESGKRNKCALSLEASYARPMPHFQPLNQLPKVRIVKPPRPSAESQRLIDACHRELMARPAPFNFDAPTAICLSASPEEVKLYQAPYSWERALKRRGPSELGIGPASVRLVLSDGDGDYLWAQRSLALRSKPGRWSWSAAGGIDAPEEHAGLTAIREAVEELGIEEQSISGLRLLGALPKLGYCTVWTARIDRDTPLAPNPLEVGSVVWARDPRLLSPLSSNLRLSWPAIRRLIPSLTTVA